MDDTKTQKVPSQLTYQAGKHTYTFSPLTEGQILAVVLSQSIGPAAVMSVAGDLLQKAGPEGQWAEFVKRLSAGEHTAEDFSLLVTFMLTGGTGDE